MTSLKTELALAAIKRHALPTLDPAVFAQVKEDVLKFYGWKWPDHLDLVEGGKALFDFLIAKQRERHP